MRYKHIYKQTKSVEVKQEIIFPDDIITKEVDVVVIDTKEPEYSLFRLEYQIKDEE